MAEADNAASPETDLGKAIMATVRAMQLDPRNHDKDESTLVHKAAFAAFNAAKKGEPLPTPPPETYSVSTVFPGIEKEFKELMAEVRAASQTDVKKGKTLTFTAAQRDYVRELAVKLHLLSMQKIAVVGHHCKHTGPIDISEQMRPLFASNKQQNMLIKQFYEHLDDLERRLGARIDDLSEAIYGTDDGQ